MGLKRRDTERARQHWDFVESVSRRVQAEQPAWINRRTAVETWICVKDWVEVQVGSDAICAHCGDVIEGAQTSERTPDHGWHFPSGLFTEIIAEVCDDWQNDRDMRVGKMLMALSGGMAPGYHPKIDRFLAALAGDSRHIEPPSNVHLQQGDDDRA